MKKIEAKAYQEGLEKGKSDAKAHYRQLLQDEKNTFEKQLASEKAAYEKKVKQAFDDGVTEGTKKMQSEIDAAITINKSNKKRKQKSGKINWNEIISQEEDDGHEKK